MVSVCDLIARAESLGARFSTEGDRLHATPKGILPDDLRVLIGDHKAEVTAEIQARESAAALVTEARTAGLELTVEGVDGLRVRHRTNASPDESLIARLADNKPAIIAALRRPASDPAPAFSLCRGGCGGRTVNLNAAGLCEVCAKPKREVLTRAEAQAAMRDARR